MSTNNQAEISQKLAVDVYAPAFWAELKSAGIVPRGDAERTQLCKLAGSLAMAGWEPPAEAKTAEENPFLARLQAGVDAHLAAKNQPQQVKTAAEQAVRTNKELRELAVAYGRLAAQSAA